MKKIILTMLAVVGFIHLSYGQDFATITNNTDCDLYIVVQYADIDCINPSTVNLNVLAGATVVAPSGTPINRYFITGATVQRFIANAKPVPYFCQQVELISPPPTCHNCTGPWPQTFTFSFDGDCCNQVVTGTWSEISCNSSGQTTELVFN